MAIYGCCLLFCYGYAVLEIWVIGDCVVCFTFCFCCLAVGCSVIVAYWVWLLRWFGYCLGLRLVLFGLDYILLSDLLLLFIKDLMFMLRFVLFGLRLVISFVCWFGVTLLCCFIVLIVFCLWLVYDYYAIVVILYLNFCRLVVYSIWLLCLACYWFGWRLILVLCVYFRWLMWLLA